MLVHVYPYVGPEAVRRRALSSPRGAPVTSLQDVATWLHRHPEARSEGATYVVDVAGRLLLAPRRSEHVACAGGADVLAAGELRFAHRGAGFFVAELSNLSTGYCPDVSCWDAVAWASRGLGVSLPEGFTASMCFRRCVACAEVNLVKEGWFVCVFCEADLPATWNVAPRRHVALGGS